MIHSLKISIFCITSALTSLIRILFWSHSRLMFFLKCLVTLESSAMVWPWFKRVLWRLTRWRCYEVVWDLKRWRLVGDCEVIGGLPLEGIDVVLRGPQFLPASCLVMWLLPPTFTPFGCCMPWCYTALGPLDRAMPFGHVDSILWADNLFSL